MRLKAITCFFAGLAIGTAYWLLSPALFGEHEPWDYSLPLYLTIMSVAGLVLGLLAERYSWAGIVGLYVGQCLVAFSRPQPNTMESIPLVLGLFAMAVYTSPSLVTAALGWLVRSLTRRARRSSEKDSSDVAVVRTRD